jgi:hypothetical protein
MGLLRMNYVDTGPFLAPHLRNDQHHDAAIRLGPTLGHAVATSNRVLDELLVCSEPSRPSYALSLWRLR